jgi:hypothetical protein
MKSNFWKFEKYIFAVVVLITAIPFLCNKYFPTVDGPAHLHNANLLKQYWFKHATNISDFYYFNKSLNSNFIDHIWFAICGLFLPTFLVEKSIILFYIIALPYSFRFLVKRISNNPHSALLSSYLIFSFIYSFTFQLGFFNFSIGIPILFWTIGIWIKNRENLSTRKIVFLAILSTLVYITHMFNFVLLGLVIFANELQYIIHSKTIKRIGFKLLKPLFIFLPGIVLAILFFISNSAFKHAPPIFLSKEKLTITLIDLSPLVTLSYEKEVFFTHIIGSILCILLLFVIYNFIRNRKKEKPVFRPNWMYPTLIVLIFFYTFPDWVVSGGFVSIRWALFFFLMIILFISSKALEPKLLVLPVTVLLGIHFYLVKYHNDQTVGLSADASALVEAENYMKDGSVLLPLSYSNNWIHVFHANYMATKKNIINLDNYEPTQPHFPLIGKKGESVFDLMPKFGNRNPPCINIDNYEQKTKHHIDYLSRFYFNGDVTDSCTSLVEKEIKLRFELIYESGDKKVQLYKRKPNT